MGATLKGGSLVLESVEVPSSVEPGRDVVATVEVVNDASFINPWSADQCSTGGFGSNYGFETTVVFTGPNGETQERTACVVSDDFHAGTETFEFTFTAPDSGGNAEISAKLKLEGSGSQSESVRETLVVGSQDPAGSDDSDGGWSWDGLDGDDDGGGDDGDGPLNTNPFEDVQGDVKIALGIVVLLAVFYTSGQLFDIQLGG